MTSWGEDILKQRFTEYTEDYEEEELKQMIGEETDSVFTMKIFCYSCA